MLESVILLSSCGSLVSNELIHLRIFNRFDYLTFDMIIHIKTLASSCNLVIKILPFSTVSLSCFRPYKIVLMSRCQKLTIGIPTKIKKKFFTLMCLLQH